MTQRTAVSFELERLALEGDELVVSGFWTGVRGMRFVRPTLLSDDRRILATLEHKPWAPSEDARWTVAFPWTGGIAVDAGSLSLVVAPKVIVPLGESVNGAPAAAEPDPAPASALARQPSVATATKPVATPKPQPPAKPAAKPTAKPTPKPTAKPTPKRTPKPKPAFTVGPAPVPARRPTPTPFGAPATAAASQPASAPPAVPVVPVDERIDDLTRALAAAERERDRALAQLAEAAAAREAAARKHVRIERAHEEAILAREEAESALARANAERQEAVAQRDESLLAFRTLQRQLLAERAGADRTARRAPDEDGAPDDDSETDEALGVRTVPAVRPVMAELQYPPRPAKRRLAKFDMFVVRVIGLAAAGCFLLLLVSILRAVG